MVYEFVILGELEFYFCLCLSRPPKESESGPQSASTPVYIGGINP